MSTLTIGQVGIDVTLSDPDAVSEAASANTRTLSIRGVVLGSTLTETIALRDELVNLAGTGEAVPVTWDEDPRIDGFYRLTSAAVDTQALTDRGFVPFTLGLELVGKAGAVVMRSKISGTVLGNDHGVTEAESEPVHAPARGHVAYDPGATVPSSMTRTGSGGAITVYRDVDFAVSPYWTITPATFYDGAALLRVGGRVRSGVDVPNLPADWRLENELVRVSPVGTSGRLNFEAHDGSSWDAAVQWQIRSGGAQVGEYDALTALRVSAEECIVRLTRDVSAGGALTLDLALRRGERFVRGYLTRHAGATLGVRLNTGEAGTAITPTGASSAVAVRSNTTTNGNRAIAGSARSFTADTTNTGLSKAGTPTLDFFIGAEVGGAGAASGDAAADLALQYLGSIAERVVAQRR